MDLHMQLLFYLDKRRILIDMNNACQAFLNQLNDKTVSKFPPLRYLLEVDVMDLLELFPEIGEFLIREPIKWQRYCNDILFACLKTSDNEMNQHVQLSQIAVNIRLKSLPQVLSQSKLRKYEGIVSLFGLLINISTPSSYVYHTVWSCPEECEGNEVILQYIPKVPPKCYRCKNTLYENSALRYCGEQVEATFKFNKDLLPKKYIIVDDLIQKLKLGETYVINAVILKKATAIWCMEEIISYPVPIIPLIPPDIKELFVACDRKPWKFIYCLASTIGIHVCPLNCFMDVKISLLFSLTSVKANNLCGSTILHVLAADYDTGYITDLMRQACLLADSNICLGPSNCSVGTTLVAASSGICLMPLPLQVYSQKQIYSIITAIEAGEIQYETNKLKLKCAVWAHGMNWKKHVQYDIASVFGTVCRPDYDEYTDELADFMLQNSMEPHKSTNEEIQALNDISIYINLIGSIKVSIDEYAQNLLSNYFVAARKKRVEVVTVGSMGSLITTCATSARLCRRSITNVNDAVFAIWLHICGMSEPRFAPSEYLQTPSNVNKLQSTMEEFIGWLEKFTNCQIGT